MLKAYFEKHILQFNFPAQTSRGIINEKPTWLLFVYDDQNQNIIGVGECSPIWGLSPENENEYEHLLTTICNDIRHYEHLLKIDLKNKPSLFFGLETALLDLFTGGKKILFNNDFTNGIHGIKINGLVWMNTIDAMYNEALDKFNKGFTCLKFKIGAKNIDEELNLLREIRKLTGNKTILRCDANGAFDFSTAKDVLTQLKTINIHSIEQPLPKGKISETQALCKLNIIPIALDEELIDIYSYEEKINLIDLIKPQYIILKPSLHGGFFGIHEWIEIAKQKNIGWWITSALESNIGLNAIAQYTYQCNNPTYHGLGTGKIYANNFPSNLKIIGETLMHDKEYNS